MTFDRVACELMTVGELPRVSLESLLDLRRLLDETSGPRTSIDERRLLARGDANATAPSTTAESTHPSTAKPLPSTDDSTELEVVAAGGEEPGDRTDDTPALRVYRPALLT